MHEAWNELSYIFKKEGGKNFALCTVCNKLLTNTAKERLKTHRYVQHFKNHINNLDRGITNDK